MYSLNEYFTVRETKEYPWPCAAEPKRKLELFPDDILTKNRDGTVTKHNGLCVFGMQVPDEDLVHVTKPVRMVRA